MKRETIEIELPPRIFCKLEKEKLNDKIFKNRENCVLESVTIEKNY